MSQKHSIPVSSCTASFAKVVSGATNRDSEIGNNDTSAEKNIHSSNMASLTEEQKVDSQEDWPSLEVVANHQNEENDIAGHKCSIKMNKIGSNNDHLEKAKTAGTEEITEKDKPTEETSATAQSMVSPSGGSRKLQKNNWKKFDIKVDYNTAQEVFMSRRMKRETPDRRKEFEKGVAPAPPPPRRNHFVNNDRESKRQNKDFGFPPRNQQQQSRIETMNQRQQKQGTGKIQNEENGSIRKENMQKENPTAPDETKKNDKPQMEEEKPFSKSPDEQQNQQNNQQHDPAYWYFDGKSNGFYYQHSGSQGWKKNIPKERQRNETEDDKSSRHSPNQNKLSNSTNLETHIDQQSINENNSVATKVNTQITQRPNVVPRSQHQQTNTSTVNHRNSTREAYANNGSGGYKNKKFVGSDQESQPNSNFAAPAKNNNVQWASTSGGMRSHQNGPRGGGYRQPFNAAGVADGGGHQRRSGANDYWRKNGNNEGIVPNSMGLSNYPSKLKEDDGGGRSNQNQYHHRRNYNNSNDRDRWPRHHPNARSPLGMEQRGARGPLPDWDQVQEFGGEERFDYVDLMENQYSQCYGLAPVAPFDPSLGIMAADTTGTAAAFSTAALAPNYLQQMHLQNRLTLATFRPGYIVAAQPPTASLQAVTATQLSAQQEMTSSSDSNAFQHLAHTPMIQQTFPPSIVTTATLPSAQTVPPTSLFSPNGMYPYSLAAVPANPIQGAAFVVTTDHHPNHQQMPIPTTTTTPFPPAMLVPTHQFPTNQNVLFTPAAPPNQQFMPYFDDQLDEILRGQIEYYFSADNLQKDFYLRSRMDAEGFLPVDLIANFPRVRKMTKDRNFIIECLRNSEQIELSEDQQKLRPRKDPHQWPLESGAHPGTESSPAFDEEDGKYAPQLPEMQQQIVLSKAITNCLSDGEQGEKNIAGKVIMEKEKKGEQKMGRNSVDPIESTEQDDDSTKEGKESSSDSSMQNAEQQTKEDDNNWLEVKTKRNKKNNRGSGTANKHMQN